MNELFDIHSYIDGWELTYEGERIWVGKTSTGAIRAMAAAREACLASIVQLEQLLAVHNHAAGNRAQKVA